MSKVIAEGERLQDKSERAMAGLIQHILEEMIPFEQMKDDVDARNKMLAWLRSECLAEIDVLHNRVFHLMYKWQQKVKGENRE